MELTSFPHSGDDEPRRQILTGLYGKVYSAASQVLNSLLSEDHDAQASGNKQASNLAPVSVPSIAVVPTPDSQEVNLPHASESIASTQGRMREVEDPQRLLPLNEVEPPLPFTSPAHHSHSPTARVLTNIPSVRFSIEQANRAGAVASSARESLGSPQPRLNRLSVGADGRPVPPTRTSSTTVSLSDAMAVPTLPGVLPPVLPQMNQPQFTAHMGPDDTASDVDSIFSVASTATSRDYLAAQYGRAATAGRTRRSHLSKDFWMKDENATSCFGCNRPFTTFRRRHHCRVCGQIFCGACTSLIASQQFDSSDRRVRCCRACESALTNHSSSEDEDVSQSFIGSPRPESIAVRAAQPLQNGQERWPDLLPPEDQEDDGAEDLSDHEELLTRARSFLGPHSRRSSSAYPQSAPFVTGSATGAGNSFDIGRRSRASSLQSEYGRQHFSPLSAPSSGIQFPQQNPWPNNSTSDPLQKSDSPPNIPHAIFSVGSNQDRASYPSSIARFLSTNTVTVDMNSASKTYAQLFLDRILSDCDMNAHWKAKLMAPVLEVTASTHLEHNDRIAPHDWVKIKRIPGSRDTIETLAGHVFTHTMARKSMPTRLVQPRLLLISFPIEYSRGPDRYMSLAPVIAQEAEYLQKLVDRIISLAPTLVLSCTHICGSAVEMLEKAGIAVATQVRESALNHLSRVTKADLLTSIDKLSSNPLLGTCTLFEVQTFRYKDLAKTFFFFMNRSSDPGRTAIIQGPPEDTVIVKIVMEIMVDVCYSLKMETALMRDQFVLIPQLPELEPKDVLSSSPFVNYGRPFLQSKATILEDEVVNLTHIIEEPALNAPEATSNNSEPGDTSSQAEEDGLDLSSLNITLDLSAVPSSTVLPTARYIQQERQSQAYQDWIEAKLQWEQMNHANPYLFNPSSHQNLLLLFSLNNGQNGTTCIGPEQMLIEFYLDTDQTIGQFVESTCLQFEDPCPEGCSQRLGDHSRSYIHGKGRLTVSVEKLPSKIPGLQESILMWSKCKVCDKEMPVTPMSQTAWKYSFGKYLELSIWGEPLKMRADTCSHDFYRNHVRYFGWHDLTISIEYHDIELYEISGPPLLLTWDPQGLAGIKVKLYVELKTKIARYWTSIQEALAMVKVEDLGEEKTKESRTRLEAMSSRATVDYQECLKMLDSTYTSTNPSNYLGLNEALFFVQGLAEKWNAEFTEFDSQFFPTERDIRLVTAQHLKGLFGEESITPGTEPSEKTALESSTHSTIQSTEQAPSKPVDDGPSEPNELAEDNTQNLPLNPHNSQSPLALPPAKDPPSLSPSAVGSTLANAIVENSDLGPRQTPKERSSRPSASSSTAITTPSSPIKEAKSISAPLKRRGSGKVLYLARHFEELSKEFELERQREHQRLRDRQRVMNMRQAQPVAEVFDDVEEAMRGDWRPTDPPSRTEGDSEVSGSKQLVSSKTSFSSDQRSIEQPTHDPPTIDQPDVTGSTGGPSRTDEPAPKTDTASIKDEDKEEDRKESTKVSLIRTLANFWAERTSMRWNNVQYVLSPTEHLFVNSLLIVRESEPSSVIAFCISLPDYKNRLADIYNRDSSSQGMNVGSRRTSISTIPANTEKPGSATGLAPLTKSSAASVAEDDLQSGSNSVLGGGPPLIPPKLPGIAAASDSSASTPAPSILGDIEDARLEETMLRQTGTHMRYHFGQGSTSISCKVFFSEQFDALRRKCGCSEDYIQSLSRCSTWEAGGGKSGSSFLKTLDDRLVVKELSQVEFDSFASFAPSYFEYMAQALFHDLPTVLAKFYGFYQITIRNQQLPSSQHIKMYVMVMENLFYGRKFTRIFDLKGSMRNRKVAETGKENEVLLDENMVEFIFEKPLFVREHSKKLLRTSLYNDTLFLTKMNVMDYSLVIGIDDESKTIVAGIIDFVRTYTWDKKIESWVKGKASAGVKEPTVVSPKQYKNRFRESMEQYFLMVPDCWMQMSTLN